LDDIEADYLKALKFGGKLITTIRRLRRKMLQEAWDKLREEGKRPSKALFEEARQLAIQKAREENMFVTSMNIGSIIEMLSPKLKP
jgi:hypothetical protein